MNENTLSSIVKDFRETARDILRMKAINNLLQDLFSAEKELTQAEKLLPEIGNETARQNYILSQLDPEDPEFDKKKELVEKTIELAIKNDTEYKKNTENYIVELNKEIKEINEKIENYETGKTKVSIDTIKELTDEMIANSYQN